VELPVEMHVALAPPSRTVGNCTLKPLTLAGAAALDALGVPFPGKIACGGDVALAAFVLSGGDARDRAAFVKFSKRLKAPYAALEDAVNAMLEDAFRTHVKAAKANDGPVRLTPHGFGWPLEILEWSIGEYGWSVETALATPVATVLGLMACWSARNRVKLAGFDYVERQYAKKLKERRHG